MADYIDVPTAATPGFPKSTILTNSDGTIAYPSVVPPAVEFPVTTPGGTKKVPALPNHSTSDLHDAPNPHQALPQETRPVLTKGWETEQPRKAAKPLFARAGTNASALNESIWSHPNLAEESSSSSSEDESPKPAHNRGHGRLHRRKITQADPNNAFRKFNVGNDKFQTRGKVSKKDGRLNIHVNENGNSGYLAKTLGATFLGHQSLKQDDQHPSAGGEPKSGQYGRHNSSISTASTATNPTPPKLNIVVMVIGSRGDIQPFLKLGKLLKEECGHRVRIATHPAFRDFVQNDSGLEFFSVGGDPAELMAFMVKNPGMIPKMDTIKAGEIGRRRDQMAEMFQGFWRACINATDDEHDPNNIKMMGDEAPFVADAIIANPPCFAHIHCAERLGVPLHLMFTFPYTPTQSFPHPLANIKKTNVDPGYTNFMSYPLVEMMTWQGLGDLVNDFRVDTLGLEPVSTLWAPGQLYRLKVPYTYLWSPGLVPKPKDWGPEIDIAGFVFLDLASSFEPPKDLVEFLDAGEPPIYIGFGSIVVDDPDKFTKMIFEAVEKAGVRALVSKGWGGLGDDNVPDNIYMLENTPHDWLFPRIKAVVHHGGAGTTAIGLKCGKPTLIVPFFGDQQFWGSMIGTAGAGPEAIPYKELTTEKLAEGLKQLLTDKCAEEAAKIAKSIEEEGDGAQNAVKSFQRSLTLRGEHSMRCSILEDRVAVWILKGTQMRLSALAATLLVQQKKISWKNLRLIRHYEWNDFEGPGEPITGITSATMSSLTSMASGIVSIPFRISKHSKKRQQHEDKKKRRSEQHERSGSGAGTIGGPQSARMKNDSGMDTAGGHEKDYAAKDDTSDNKTPVKKHNQATVGQDMGKHTANGEPAKTKDGKAEPKKDENDNASILSADPEQGVAEEIATDVGTGLGKTGEALARVPMDLTLAIAQGFHNAPRLYGDTTVRRPTRITGYKSGLKAGGEEFVYGVYDGFSGLVTQPYRHTRDEGAIGLVKGVSFGLTGFVLKDLAAIFGVIGYPLKGVHKEMIKHRQPTHFIRKARILKGQRDLRNSEQTEKDSELVLHGWTVAQQIWSAMDETRSQGLRGRLKVMKERKKWRSNGAFENVEMAEKALAARKNGEDVADVFAQQRRELQEANDRPRKAAMDDVRDRNQVDGGKEEKANETAARKPCVAAA